jgi:uncharacterized membrane protein
MSGQRSQIHPCLLLVVFCVLSFYFSSCGSGDAPLSVVDPNAAPLQPTYEQVEAIVVRNCAPCHSSGEASGEDDDLDYSTCRGIEAGIEGIENTVFEGGSMPPGAWPRIGERDKLILKRWIDQGACSPCKACP